MSKVKRNYIDTRKINKIGILKIAQDWGVEVYEKSNGEFALYCPNPNHHDRHLGNCFINSEKNCFYCFACGVGGGPIQFVMNLENCDYNTAKYKIAKKYGLIKTEYVDAEDLPPKWEGLTYEEYAEAFGLSNISIKIPTGIDEKGNVQYLYKRYTLRDFARENPEAHDEMLIGKFFERIYALASFMHRLDNKKFPGLTISPEWEKACLHYADYLKTLLKKGLMDKNKFFQLFTSSEAKDESKETPLAKCV